MRADSKDDREIQPGFPGSDVCRNATFYGRFGLKCGVEQVRHQGLGAGLEPALLADDEAIITYQPG